MMVASAQPLLGLLLHGGDFSWTTFSVHPSVLAGCMLLSGVYLLAAGPLRRRFALGDEVSGWRIASFMSGTLLLFLSLNGPLHDLSDYYLFSAHMIQHLVITLIVPPLWLIGIPPWMLRPLLRGRFVWGAVRFLTLPLTAFVVYNVVMMGWHVPRLYNAALEAHGLHVLQHLTFIAAAVLMWWPVASPLPELTRLSPPLKMLYLFAFGVPMTIVAALITLSGDVLYMWYDAAPRLWSLSALDDQQLGGLIMWVPAMKVYWIAITVLFFRWSRRESEEEAREGARRGAPQGELVVAAGRE